MAGRRSRGWSTSCSSTTSQSSMTSIYPSMNQSSAPAGPTEGHANVYGSFTTTVPAALWLRTHLKLAIPGIRRGKQRAVIHDVDSSPPDSPLSFLHSVTGHRRSPSISRTLMTDFDWAGSPTEAPPSPLPDNDGNSSQLHPILKAVEKKSKFSCRTICSTCKKVGSNYPRCPRCDEKWCSRACRLQGGKKHRCIRPRNLI